MLAGGFPALCAQMKAEENMPFTLALSGGIPRPGKVVRELGKAV